MLIQTITDTHTGLDMKLQNTPNKNHNKNMNHFLHLKQKRNSVEEPDSEFSGFVFWSELDF